MSRSVLHDLDLFTKTKPRAFCPHPLYDHYGQRQDRNESLRQLHLNPEAKYVLFFGFIRAYKGLDLLLQAFADPRMKQHNINLIVAGEFYEDAQPYLTQIEKLNIADRVVLHTDFIPDNEVRRYFSAADLVAQPYKTATQSGVTQIAFHFEKAMLVTNVGGLPEIVPNGKIGFVVSPNANEITEAILNFFNQNLQETFEQNIREEKKKYEWQRLLETIENLTNTTAQQ
ncbi:MAG: glycosyltransferase, partial [Bacteroidales bacterium]|nr:glycosyltransferase [Bacteroidales bacterium]